MVGGMSSREMVTNLKAHGWTDVRSKGSHHTWKCPTGKHQATVPTRHRTISAGVVRTTNKKIEACNCKEP